MLSFSRLVQMSTAEVAAGPTTKAPVTTTTTTKATTTKAPVTTTKAPDTTTATPTPSAGLQTGAIVGIVFGVIAGLLALGIGGYFLKTQWWDNREYERFDEETA